MKNNIYVIGANLYGCLTAAKLAKKNKNSNIVLVDSADQILNTFQSIKLKKYKINNGFHSIEIPRANALVNFLRKEIKVDLKIIPNIRKILINNFLVPEENSNNYPENLKKHFKKKSINTSDHKIFLGSLSKSMKNHYVEVSKRYAQNFFDVKHFFIPWFFPTNYTYKSNDEGDQFRKKVRSKKIKAYYVLPKNGLIEELRTPFIKYFRKIKNIKMMLNTNVGYHENQLFLFSKNFKNNFFPKDKIYLCVPPLFLLKKNEILYKKIFFNKRYLANMLIRLPATTKKIEFTEIISCHKELKELARISNYSLYKSIKNYQLIQIELILNKVNKINLKNIYRKLKNILSFFSHKEKLINFKVIDLKITRSMFYPKIEDVNKVKKYFIRNLKKLPYNINYNFFLGPVNMSKQWKFSEKFKKI
jgi:hypothetical protein